MRFVRVNALAVDFGVLPKHPGPASIQKFLESELQLDIATLLSVQIHSTRGIAYVGLPEDLPAAAIANRHHLQHEMQHDGKFYRIPIMPADDDAIDVRVYDLPPEVPEDAIAAKFRQYGEVLAVTEEVWKHFFPGVKSGVRVVRMRVSHPIPRHIAIPNTTLQAHVRYPGQARKPEAAAAPLEPEPEPAPTAAKKKRARTSTASIPAAAVSSVQKQNDQPASSTDQPVAGTTTRSTNEEEAGGFTIVCRNRSKFKRQQSEEPATSAAKQQQQKRFFATRGDNTSSSDSELDFEQSFAGGRETLQRWVDQQVSRQMRM